MEFLLWFLWHDILLKHILLKHFSGYDIIETSLDTTVNLICILELLSHIQMLCQWSEVFLVHNFRRPYRLELFYVVHHYAFVFGSLKSDHLCHLLDLVLLPFNQSLSKFPRRQPPSWL